jgi:fructose-1,6-bisphosphatase/inositol monophosphatase family enzyme
LESAAEKNLAVKESVLNQVVGAANTTSRWLRQNNNRTPSELDAGAEHRFQKKIPSSIGVIGEEGAFSVKQEHQHCILLDPLDGSSLMGLGRFDVVSVSAAVIEITDLDLQQQSIAGKPVASVIKPVFRDEIFVSKDGQIRNLPREKSGLAETLRTERKSLVSAYAMNNRRQPVVDNFHRKIAEQYPNTVMSLFGGSFTSASVAWGRCTVSGEPSPTVPTEAAGTVFAKAAGMHVTDRRGNKIESVRAEAKDGLSETFTSVITPTKKIDRQVRDAADLGKIANI